MTLKLRDNQTTVRTDDRGRFSGSLALSLGQLFLGPQTLQITVQPGEPWHSAISTQVAVFIVNVANLGVLSIAVSYFAFLLAMIWRRQRYRSSPVPAHEPAPLLPGTQGTPVVTPLVSAPAWAYIDPNTPRGRIVSAYHRAARFLESDLGVSFQPHYTFRDFLATIGSHVRTAFAELTRITERALYGVYGYDEQEARHAEELARATQGEGT